MRWLSASVALFNFFPSLVFSLLLPPLKLLKPAVPPSISFTTVPSFKLLSIEDQAMQQPIRQSTSDSQQ